MLLVLCENTKDDNVSRTGGKVNEVVMRRFLESWRQFFVDAENRFNQEASHWHAVKQYSNGHVMA